MATLTHQVFITVQDAKGLQSTLIVHLPFATVPQDAIDFAELLVDEVDPLIKAGVVAAGVTFATDIAGHETIQATSDVQEKGEFAFRTVNNFLFRFALSGFDENFVVASSQQIDLTDANVIDLVDAMIDGLIVPSTATVIPVDSRAEDLTVLESGLERFRRRARIA